MKTKALLILLALCALLVGLPSLKVVSLPPQPPVSTPTVRPPMRQSLDDIFSTDELMTANILDLQRAKESGRLTSEQLVMMYLERIASYDSVSHRDHFIGAGIPGSNVFPTQAPNRNNFSSAQWFEMHFSFANWWWNNGGLGMAINSIISLNPHALEEAAVLDAERAAGNVRGPMHGIPVLVKDNIDVAGLVTSGGSIALQDSYAPNDAFIIGLLREAGAIVIAKNNLSEFSSSARHSRSTLGGVTHNPFDPSRTPAGSSGGTGAAVASLFGTVGIGTDTGSSIRRPANINGIFGLRPTQGLMSRHGIIPLNMENDTAGPMTRCVIDLAIMLDVMAAQDPFEISINRHVVPGFSRPDSFLDVALAADINSLDGARIGVLQSSFTGVQAVTRDLYNDMRAAFDLGGATFVNIGHRLTNANINNWIQNTGPGLNYAWEMNQYFAGLGPYAPVRDQRDFRNGRFVRYIDWIHGYFNMTNPTSNPRNTHAVYARNMQNRHRFRDNVERIMDEFQLDAIIYLNYTGPAGREFASHAGGTHINNHPNLYTARFGPIAGMPSLAIPMGLANTNSNFRYAMPMGIELVGRAWDESRLIELAVGFTEATHELGRQRIQNIPTFTPVLPDANLHDFAQALLADFDALSHDLYTYESVAALVELFAGAESALEITCPTELRQFLEPLAAGFDSLVRIQIPEPPCDGYTPPPKDDDASPTIFTPLIIASTITLGVVISAAVLMLSKRRR